MKIDAIIFVDCFCAHETEGEAIKLLIFQIFLSS